jgi:PAS domain-containing protein
LIEAPVALERGRFSDSKPLGLLLTTPHALRTSEQRLQAVIDNTTAVVFIKDLELRYVLVNREYERLFQVQRDRVQGKTDFEIHP